MAEASQDKFNSINSQSEYIAPEIEENELSDTDLEKVAGGAGRLSSSTRPAPGGQGGFRTAPTGFPQQPNSGFPQQLR